MYIHRSVLLLFIFILLIFLVGMDWITASGAPWYRPFLAGLAIITLAAVMQRLQAHDDY